MIEGFVSASEYLLSNPFTFVLLILGVVWGILFGATPGLTGVVGVALLIPFTFVFEPIEGLVMLGAVYVGSTFGGSISAILFNTPGSPEASCTSLDGYPMAKKGQAGMALGLALGSSAIGGIFGTIALILLAPPLADFALAFGPSEYFALAILGITAIASIGSKSIWKALIAGFLGLGLATVGIDPLTGFGRFTFGTDSLLTGISFIPALIGLFALSEVLARVGATSDGDLLGGGVVSTKLPRLREVWALRITLLRSSVIGTLIGT